MKTNRLGKTNLHVSEICLGTMTWGTQNTEQEGHEQIDVALDHGVNFIDTAELYPTTPISKATYGDTEKILGTWLAKNASQREDLIIASKVVGGGIEHIRQGSFITPINIDQAIEGSLKRLQTDYIDLYQLHWPNRGSYHFRANWSYSAQEQPRQEEEMRALLDCLEKHIKAGRIRHIGLSNETAWGTMKFLEIAEKNNFTKPISVQNEYSLMDRKYDLDMAEVSHHEQIGLLAYSPLAAGLLSGKYYNGAVPEGSRGSINVGLYERITPESQPVADAYTDLAKEHDLDPSQMALAFCLTRPFVSSVIIGATTQEQLITNLKSSDVTLDKKVMQGIQDIYRKFPLPF